MRLDDFVVYLISDRGLMLSGALLALLAAIYAARESRALRREIRKKENAR